MRIDKLLPELKSQGHESGGLFLKIKNLFDYD